METVFNKGQSLGYESMLKGLNVFLTGGGGVGKSFVLNKYIETLQNMGKNLIVVAPTGIAALNINGATIHRVFKAPLKPIVEKVDHIVTEVMHADTIIIDEISMCRIDLFEYIAKQIIGANKLRRKNNKSDIQIIVSGDFYQLPPVITDRDREVLEAYYGDELGRGFAFQSKYWEIFGFKTIILNEVVRQADAEFATQLNLARVGDIRSLNYFTIKSTGYEIKNAITLCGTNKAAQEKSNIELSKIKSKGHEYQSSITGDIKDSDKMTADTLLLKENARVMTLINDPNDYFNNGSFGTIKKLYDESIEIQMDNGKLVELPYNTWEVCGYKLVDKKVEKVVVGTFSQIPVKLAYAITIHKSQGQTYDAVNLNPYCWDCGQLYVALSRVKNIDMMHLTSQLNPKYLITAKEVKDFYSGLTEKKITPKYI